MIEIFALLFDLDGVLVDSAPATDHSWRVWASEQGLDGDEILKTSHGRRRIDTLGRIVPGSAHDAHVARLIALEHEAIDLVRPIPGAREFVGELDGLPWAIATSAEREIAERRLRKAQIALPTVFITAERVQHGKPDPEVYLLAATELEIDPRRCVVFEDAPVGIEAGKRAGSVVVGLSTTVAQTFLEAADIVIRDFRDARIERTSGAAIRLHFNHR